MKIKEIMTRKVFYLGKHNTVIDAIKIMGSEDIGAVPITDESQKVIGIVTDRDLIIRCLYEGKSTDSPLGDYMSENVMTIQEDESIGSVVSLMSDKQIKRVPITNNDGVLSGIVSLGDLATHTASQAKSSEALRNISMPPNDFSSNPNHDNKVEDFPL